MQASIILTLNERMASHDILIVLMPLLGDIFVFTYPIYLLYLYFSSETQETGKRRNKLLFKKEKLQKPLQNKYSALTIFFTTLFGILSNYFIKIFVQEPRPFHSLDLAIDPHKALVLDGLPVDTFPSDHATVGMTVAMSTLLLGYHYNNKSIKKMGWIFLGFTLIMNFARIVMGIHRPADILGGMGVGLVVASTMLISPIYQRFQTTVYDPLISRQEQLFEAIRRLFSFIRKKK